MIEKSQPYLPLVNIIYLPALSECLSRHVDPCRCERGSGFIDSGDKKKVPIERLVAGILVDPGGGRLHPLGAS